MRYTKEELETMAQVHLKTSNVIYGTTDGHFFKQPNEAAAYCKNNRVEYFEFGIKKTTKKAE